MKFRSSISKFLAVVSVLLLLGATLHAEESSQPALTPGQHLVSKDNGTMGSMHMDEMMKDMNECKNMHMEAKLCDHQMMEKCQKNMGKGECQKMMKQAKANQKTEKKK